MCFAKAAFHVYDNIVMIQIFFYKAVSGVYVGGFTTDERFN
jgi:hypothetical protein